MFFESINLVIFINLKLSFLNEDNILNIIIIRVLFKQTKKKQNIKVLRNTKFLIIKPPQIKFL